MMTSIVALDNEEEKALTGLHQPKTIDKTYNYDNFFTRSPPSLHHHRRRLLS